MLGKKDDLYYFQMINDDEKIYCLLDFNIYLALMILCMQVPETCILRT